ncbi:MAG: S4 domain-containing protein, partial [Erysipelotrichaceae bacterium]
MREMHIQANDANQRVDKFIAKAVPLLPKALLYKYIRNKKIKVNHKRCEIAQRLCEGDIITFYMAEEFFDDAIDLSFLQCRQRLVPLYEDEHVLLIHKAVGESVQPDEKYPLDNVVNALKK